MANPTGRLNHHPLAIYAWASEMIPSLLGDLDHDKVMISIPFRFEERLGVLHVQAELVTNPQGALIVAVIGGSTGVGAKPLCLSNLGKFFLTVVTVTHR